MDLLGHNALRMTPAGDLGYVRRKLTDAFRIGGDLDGADDSAQIPARCQLNRLRQGRGAPRRTLDLLSLFPDFSRFRTAVMFSRITVTLFRIVGHWWSAAAAFAHEIPTRISRYR